MIKTLKRKFIISSMIAVSILLIGFFVIVNFINLKMMNADADHILNALNLLYTVNDDSFPDDIFSSTENLKSLVRPERTDGKSDLFEGRFSADEVLHAVFFTAVFSPSDELISTDISRISTVMKEEAKEIALIINSKDKSRGWYDNYKYLSSVNTNGNTVYFILKRTTEKSHFVDDLMGRLLICAASFVLMLLVVILLSNIVIKPVARSIDVQKRFVTNAGHEIKTPLAIIQANTEALELYEGSNKWTENIKSQIMRLSSLMNDMLVLARADEIRDQILLEDVDLRSVTEEYIRMFTEPASKKDITFVTDISGAAMIKANKEFTGQVMSIVFDNAVKYSINDSVIELNVSDRDRHTYLEISNITEVIPDCEPERLFERFFRPDSTRYTENKGNGIGLSAARIIMELSDGSIRCRYNDNKVIFTLMFNKK